MIEYDCYIKRRNGLWSCIGSYPTIEMAMKAKELRHSKDDYFIKKSIKRG